MANRRQFMRTLSGVAALSVTTDVSKLGRTHWLRMATAMPDTGSARPPANRTGTGARSPRCSRR